MTEQTTKAGAVTMIKRDDALWLKHLREAGFSILSPMPVTLMINGVPIDFGPMERGSNGRTTTGLKAIGPNAAHWKLISKGASVTVDWKGVPSHRLTEPSTAPSVTATSEVPSLAVNEGPLPLITGRLEICGAVAGFDVGYSEARATTGMGVLTWDEQRITVRVRNARTGRHDRLEKLAAISPADGRVSAAAVDGPLLPGLGIAPRYRACEAILSAGPLQKRGKPGQTHAASGPRLHEEATVLARLALDALSVAPAPHRNGIHPKAVAEAFPNMFLGTLHDEGTYPAVPVQKRKWTDTLYPRVEARLRSLVTALLPGRSFDLPTLRDHEEIAAFTCAVTALCVAAGAYTAVGSAEDGWIILPPRAFLGEGWSKTLDRCCASARVRFPNASVSW